jgi:hypothetical protein
MGLGCKGFRISERKLENGVTGFWGRGVGAASDRAGRVEGWDCFMGGDVTGQSVPDLMRWRGESLKTMQDHSAQ